MKSAFVSLLLLGSFSAVASADPLIWGTNDHAYEAIRPQSPTTYSQAKAAAEASTYRGVSGRLLVLETPDYSAELAFVATSVVRPNSAGYRAFYLGVTRPDSNGDARQNWTWDDGTSAPTSVTNGWSIDFAEGNQPYAGIFFDGDNYSNVWDYSASNSANFATGYVVEYAAPVPEPATIAALGIGAAATLRRRKRGA